MLKRNESDAAHMHPFPRHGRACPGLPRTQTVGSRPLSLPRRRADTSGPVDLSAPSVILDGRDKPGHDGVEDGAIIQTSHRSAIAAAHDLRFPALVGAAAWSNLPPAVRERFSRRLAPGDAVTYAGEIVESRRTRIGWLLAQACRVIGAPLPLDDVPGVAAVVTVMEDAAGGGQFWTRMYARPRGFPQAIQSAKRFTGATGLEEYLGGGFGIALTVHADDKALNFISDHYFLRLGPARLRLPPWLAPGRLVISHVDLGDGAFAFVLSLRHPLAGEIVRQTGRFRERPAISLGDPS